MRLTTIGSLIIIFSPLSFICVCSKETLHVFCLNAPFANQPFLMLLLSTFEQLFSFLWVMWFDLFVCGQSEANECFAHLICHLNILTGCWSSMASDCHCNRLHIDQIARSLLSILGAYIYSTLCKWSVMEDSVVCIFMMYDPQSQQDQQCGRF